jgi:hypothetical protein
MNHQKSGLWFMDEGLVQENDPALGVGQRVGQSGTSRQGPAAEELNLKVGCRGLIRSHSRWSWQQSRRESRLGAE